MKLGLTIFAVLCALGVAVAEPPPFVKCVDTADFVLHPPPWSTYNGDECFPLARRFCDCERATFLPSEPSWNYGDCLMASAVECRNSQVHEKLERMRK